MAAAILRAARRLKAVAAPMTAAYSSFTKGYGAGRLPIRVDWRLKDAVTPVQNQYQRGSCWAFAATGSVEGLHQIQTGDLFKLSEQQLVDCNDVTNWGCWGGYSENAFNYIMMNGGLVFASVYPYTARKGVYKQITSSGINIQGWQTVPPNEAALKFVVAQQPIVVRVKYETKFKQYTRGLVDGGRYEVGDLNHYHYMLLVGYDQTLHGELYWILKTSHGIEFGDGGYMYLKREVGLDGGALGLARRACYPLLSSYNPFVSVKLQSNIMAP